MGTKSFNFTSFTPDQKVHSTLLDRRTSAEAKKHPEYGILPFNAQCKECVELVDQRTKYTRFFVDPVRGTHTFSQESYFPLHYRDRDGQWRTIDHRLRPEQGHAGVYSAVHQPLPVRFDLHDGYTAIDLHSCELIHNRNLKMYYVENKNDAASNSLSADYSHYTVGDDGARVYNIWPGIDMEAFAKEGEIETNFIIVSKPRLPVRGGYMVIEDHINVPEGYTLVKAGGLNKFNGEDLLLRGPRGNTIARIGHVRIRNADKMSAVTEYVVEKHKDGYAIRMLVPYTSLDLSESSYPVVVDPIVTGFDSIGNYDTTHLPSANMNFTTLPGHCDYHMTVTVPGMSQLVTGYMEVEAKTKSNPYCGDTAFGINGHECLLREVLFVIKSDTCNVSSGFIRCQNGVNAHGCDSTGLVTTNGQEVPGAGPISIPDNPFLSCLPPQCPDYHLGFTLENSDSSCEDACGQLCAEGTRWAMTIEACQIDAYLTAVDTNVCAGLSTTVTCHPSCGVPPYHYLWSTGDTTQSITVYPAVVGTDVVCTAYDACNNPVYNAPDLLISQIPLPTADAGPGGQVCEGGTVTLGGSPTTSSGNTVSWSASPVQAQSWLSDANAANPTVTVPPGTVDTVMYILTVSNASCSTYDTAYVYSLPDPMAAIDTTGPTKICNGQSVTLNANGPFSSYLWSTGSTAQSITVSSPGSYYVIVTDNNNCKDTSSSVTVSTVQVSSFNIYPDTTIFYGDTVQLHADISLSPPAVDSFFWAPGDSSISCVRCASPYVAPLSEEMYYLTVYTQGCILSDSLLINVILPDDYYIPNAFTPNGDGINDLFFMYGQSGVWIDGFKVYDRWGEKVYDAPFPWDGTYKGQKCEPGVYVYVFTIRLFGHQNDDVRKGSFTLIR